ncbi:MAG: DUF1624 domain-containing protein [Lewinellaceae bacterium]|nr:DUF1624 domain-containing protein [Lewinellaceae bacterium]
MENKNIARVDALDVLRGLVIVLMALDHIRDFWAITPFAPEDVSQTTPGWFFTRWITHFCAPIFVFLAGMGAYLYGQKVGDLRRLSRFLFTRGLWLIVLEFTAINLSWMFEWPWNEGFMFGQVIWVIGMSMVLMAALVRLPLAWIAGIGIALIAGHNLLDGVTPESWGSLGWLWKFLHIGFAWIPLNAQQSFGFLVVYPLIPWVGVMAAGYATGPVMRWEAARRQTWLLRAGLALILLFIALRAGNWYGDPVDWAPQSRGPVYSLLSFLNVAKYPPSLLFLCMTLGPGFLLLVLFERWKSPLTDFFQVYGRVPFFFYVIHFSLLHASARLYYYLTKGWHVDFFSNGPQQWPEGYTPNLALAYIVWFLFIPLMYFPCYWYGKYKFTHRHWWLKYL